jgi:hypothetical protein
MQGLACAESNECKYRVTPVHATPWSLQANASTGKSANVDAIKIVLRLLIVISFAPHAGK